MYVTRQIPEIGLAALRAAGHELVVSEKDGGLTHEELLAQLSLRPYEAIVSLLTDQIDASVLDAAPQVRLIANYAVGYNMYHSLILRLGRSWLRIHLVSSPVR